MRQCWNSLDRLSAGPTRDPAKGPQPGVMDQPDELLTHGKAAEASLWIGAMEEGCDLASEGG